MFLGNAAPKYPELVVRASDDIVLRVVRVQGYMKAFKAFCCSTFPGEGQAFHAKVDEHLSGLVQAWTFADIAERHELDAYDYNAQALSDDEEIFAARILPGIAASLPGPIVANSRYAEQPCAGHRLVQLLFDVFKCFSVSCRSHYQDLVKRVQEGLKGFSGSAFARLSDWDSVYQHADGISSLGPSARASGLAAIVGELKSLIPGDLK